MFHVGRTLRRIREHAALAAAEVARRAGLTGSGLSRAEGKPVLAMSEKNLTQVLAALGLTHDQWLMLVAADWDGSSSGWHRYRLVVASHLLDPRRLSELAQKAEQFCHDAEIELPHDLPKPPPEVDKKSRLVAVRERPKVILGGHVEQVARVYEAPEESGRRGSSKKSNGHGQTAHHGTAKTTAGKARKRSG